MVDNVLGFLYDIGLYLCFCVIGFDDFYFVYVVVLVLMGGLEEFVKVNYVVFGIIECCVGWCVVCWFVVVINYCVECWLDVVKLFILMVNDFDFDEVFLYVVKIILGIVLV